MNLTTLTALLILIPTLAFAEPCTGITKDKAIELLPAPMIEEVLLLEKSEVDAIQQWAVDNKMMGSIDPEIMSAVHVLFVDGSAAIGTFDKDEKMCGHSDTNKAKYEQLKAIAYKNKV